MSILDTLRQGIIAPPGKRKRSKKEAKKRIRSIPIPPPKVVPPILRPAIVAGPRLAEVLVDIDPFGLTAPEPTLTPTPPIVRGGDSPGNIARRFQEGARLRQQQQRMSEQTMPTDDTIREMINDPQIVLTAEDLPVINDPEIMLTMDNQLVRMAQFVPVEEEEEKKKRKVSKYQRELGRQLKMLKKKHPRTKVTALMKRAHRATRKALSK